MVKQLIASNLDISTQEVDRLIRKGRKGVLQDDNYRAILDGLDNDLLTSTLADARAVYDQYLPNLIDDLEKRFGYTGNPMSAHTLGNWLLGFLHSPDHLVQLLAIHDNLSPEFIEFGLADILDFLSAMPEGGQAWQGAMSALALPLLAD